MDKSEFLKAEFPIKVTFFGDSVCVGQGVSIYRGWVTRIAQFLDDYGQHIGREILVTNSSVNGRTTRQALEDMPYHVQSHGADILVVQFGLNDCNYWATDRGLPRVSIEAFIANLREIIDRGKCFGAKQILLNNNHPTSRNKDVLPFTGFTYEASNHRYNEAVRALACEFGKDIYFQDIESHFQNLIESKGISVERFLLSDGLHLSDEGHAHYYELICPIIKKAIDDYLFSSAKS